VLKIPFMQFNITNFRLFDVILKMAGMVIQNSESYQRVLLASPYHHLWMVERDHHFFNQLKEARGLEDDGLDLLLAGFHFQPLTPPAMKRGFMTLISQLSIKTGARVAVLGEEACFALHHPSKSPREIQKDLEHRYQGYGISLGFAALKTFPSHLCGQDLLREHAFLTHLLTQRFMSHEVEG